MISELKDCQKEGVQTLTKDAIVGQLKSAGALGIVRLEQTHDVMRIIQSLREGDLTCVEVTMNTPGILRGLEKAAASESDVLLGAGTVLDAISARLAILAGAEFIVTPTLKLNVIEVAHRYGKAAVCGAMTPSEILTAWEAGADIVKVFPADVLGPAFIRAMQGPLPQIPLAPTGGVTAETAKEFIRAGATIVCAGGWLVDKEAVAEGDYGLLTERARLLMGSVREGRGPSKS